MQTTKWGSISQVFHLIIQMQMMAFIALAIVASGLLDFCNFVLFLLSDSTIECQWLFLYTSKTFEMSETTTPNNWKIPMGCVCKNLTPMKKKIYKTSQSLSNIYRFSKTEIKPMKILVCVGMRALSEVNDFQLKIYKRSMHENFKRYQMKAFEKGL